jgi:hypothetical protein
MPCGIVEEDRAQLRLPFGSSGKTSACIVEVLEAWWAALAETAQVAMAKLQITSDNGPESRGKRTPCLQRMVAFCAGMGKPMPLLYSPPSQRKYNPIERCWGLLEWHWNGTKLVHGETMLEWAKRMPWKGIHPLVELSQKGSQKGVALSKRAMHAVEARLARHPALPKWDMLILPAGA